MIPLSVARRPLHRGTFASASTLMLAASSILLSGCALQPAATPAGLTGSAIQGRVHGGQQPVSGAVIQLYAAAANGYGVPATYTTGTSLLGSHSVSTDAKGNFAITGDYTCPTAATPVFLVATGGNPGLSADTNNSAIALMAAIGPCGQLTPQTFLEVNELTTVAAVWSLSAFMTGPSAIGTSPAVSPGTGNLQGLTNAFATANKLVNLATGAPGGPALPAGATLPVQKMNTIADMLAACVNSAGDTGATSPCGVLFQSTTSGSTVPSETATAAMILAQNPGLPSSSLFTLVDATAPFQPTLPAAPTDFSLVIHYTGAGIAQPSGLAVDPAGNIWVANAGSNSLTVFDASGVNSSDPAGFLSGANGFAPAGLLAPSAVAIDALGNAWTTGGKSNNLISLSPSGSLLASYSGSNFNLPAGVAIDNLGTVWVTNSGNSTLAEVSSTGTITAVTSGPLAQPTAIVINPH